jgi:uncharacterized membrane protein
MFLSKILKKICAVLFILSLGLGLKSSVAGDTYEELKDVYEVARLDSDQLEVMKKIGLQIMSQMNLEKQQELLGVAAQIARTLRNHRADIESKESSGEIRLKQVSLEMKQLFAHSIRVFRDLPATLIEAKTEEDLGGSETLLSIQEEALVYEELILRPKRTDSSRCAHWNKMIASSCATACTVTGVLAGCMTENPWVKATLFMVSAALLNSAGTLAGQLVTVPGEWSEFSNILVKSVLNALLGVPSNMLYYSAMQIGQEPGSSVSLIALNSLSGFFSALSITEGEIVFFNEPSNWPAWVGVAAIAAATALQTWHAIEYPTERR